MQQQSTLANFRLSKTVLLSLALILGVLAGCTSSSTGSVMSVDLDKALSDHTQLGLNYLGEGNRKQARFHLLKALEIDGKSAGAHNGMALLYQLELENELAESHFKKAITYDKTFTRARNNYGVFLFKENRYQEAYSQFQSAGEDTNYELRPQVFYSMGVTAQRMGKEAAAEEAWIKAIALEPQFAFPYLELAESYFQNSEFLKAKSYLAAFDKRSRPMARSLWLAVRLHHQLGDKDAQASKGLALEKLFPNSPENKEYQEWLKK